MDLSGIKIDLRPRSYEIVFVLFALISIYLLKKSPLPLSKELAMVLGLKIVSFICSLYGLTLLIVGLKLGLAVRKNGWQSVFRNRSWVRFFYPYWTLDYLVLTLRRCVSMLGIIYFFLHIKHIVLTVHFANYDQLFWNLDRWVHFGIQPNVALMKAFGTHHHFAILVDYLYFQYFQYTFFMAMLFLLEIKGRELAEKFFLGVALLWSLGGFSYMIMPADGPCYAVLSKHAIPPGFRTHFFNYPVPTVPVDPDYYKKYDESKIWIAKFYQEQLWKTRFGFIFEEKLPIVFYGIAAMPSLHVAGTALYMFYLFMVSRLFGILGLLFTCFMLFGSVFLQWHYAVDGYVGFLFAYGIWFFATGRKSWLPHLSREPYFWFDREYSDSNVP